MPTLKSVRFRFFHVLVPRLFLSLLLLLPYPAYSLDIELPDMGDPADTLMTPAAEKRLGRAFIRNLKNRQRFIEQPVYEDYLQSLGKRIASNSDNPGRHFQFHLIDSHVINAFAAPDGQIGINTGLILTSESESELAAVLAHEVAHVTQKHLMRTFYRAQQMSIPAAVAMLAAVLVGVSGGGAQIGSAAMTGIQAGMLQDRINYTRHNEEEADRLGMATLSKSKFDPRAMPAFFGRMAKANQAYSSKLPELLRTHPVTTNRIGDSLGRASRYPYKQRKENIRYHLLRAWLKMRSFSQPSKAIKHFKSSLRDGRYRNKEAQEYGYALALMQKRAYGDARPILARLLAKRPRTIEYRIALANLDALNGRTGQALQTIATGRKALPRNKPLAIKQAELYKKRRNHKRSAKILFRLTKNHPNDARLFLKLSRAEAKSGKRADAHAAMAEHYYLEGQLKSAIQQLETALRQSSLSDFQAAKFAARLKNIKREYVELENLRKNR